jgi:TetR/AcrR family transcriptional regulator
VDTIAKRAGVNKQALYYHFGNKEDLFRTSLISGYEQTLRRNEEIDVSRLPPIEAMTVIVDDMFLRIKENREMMALILDENRFEGRHLQTRIRHIIDPLVQKIAETLGRGEKAGVFIIGVKPDELYIDIVSVCMLYFSNIHTLSALLGRDLSSAKSVAQRRTHVVRFILSALCVNGADRSANLMVGR